MKPALIGTNSVKSRLQTLVQALNRNKFFKFPYQFLCFIWEILQVKQAKNKRKFSGQERMILTAGLF